MNLFVDTSVWSLALRRDAPTSEPAVHRLRVALETGEAVFTTGLVLQELLQGLHGPRDRDALVERFDALPLVMPDRLDHIAAAELRNACRRRGVQAGTADSLLAQLCVRNDFVMLTTDRDFEHMVPHTGLDIWAPIRS
jgi:predicted nucleic acid-binding protein